MFVHRQVGSRFEYWPVCAPHFISWLVIKSFSIVTQLQLLCIFYDSYMNCMDIDNCSYFSDDHPREHSCHAPQLPRHPDGILQDDRQRQSKFLQPLHLLHLSPTQQQQQPPAPERHNWRFWPATRTTVGAKRHLRSFLQNQSVTHPMDSFLVEQYSPLPVLVKLLALCGQKGTLV